ARPPDEGLRPESHTSPGRVLRGGWHSGPAPRFDGGASFRTRRHKPPEWPPDRNPPPTSVGQSKRLSRPSGSLDPSRLSALDRWGDLTLSERWRMRIRCRSAVLV